MAYTKTTWRNNQSPAINADNLNHIEQGVYEAHQDIAENTQSIENLVTQANANTSAITSETIARQQADSAETLAREQTDSNLQSQINQIIAPSGEAPSAAEVENARIAASIMGGETYDTLGNAIRGQVTDLKSILNACAIETKVPLEQGSLTTNTGQATSSTIRLRSFTMISKGIYQISVDSGYKFAVFVYNIADNSYVGVWNGSSVALGDPVWFTSEKNIYSLQQTYNLRILFANTSNTTITVESVNHFHAYYGNGLRLNDAVKLINAKIVTTPGLVRLDNGKIGVGYQTFENREEYCCTPKYVKVIPDSYFCINSFSPSVSDAYSIVEYDSNFTYLKSTDIDVGKGFLLTQNTSFVKFRFYKPSQYQSAKDVIANVTMYCQSDVPQLIYNTSDNNTSYEHISFYYKVSETAFTTGKLMLPSNYSVFGEAVPLIVFVHGSADYSNIVTQNMTTNYLDYYKYLRDCGYAIFDCFGYSNDVATQGSNTWGLPVNMHCYKCGIEYVCNNWNIDKRNIFVTAKSLGGCVASLFAFEKEINAVGMLAPELNMLVPTKFGYTRANRVIIASQLNFSGDWQSILDVDNDSFVEDDEYKALMTANASNIAGCISTWKWLNTSLDDKISTSLAKDFSDKTSVQSALNPVKIWIALDDNAVSYSQSSGFIQHIKNGGCEAYLRTMPSGTGGHHSVDNDANAPQTTNVTTKLGITYASVPTAYYELREYFDEHLI